MSQNEAISRRDFVANGAKAVFGATIVPRFVLGGPGYLAPSDRVNVALMGAGGRGTANALALLAGEQNLVAIADVDFANVAAVVDRLQHTADGKPNPRGVQLKEAYEKAKRYSDVRDLLDRERDLDAVLIATPDHLHAVIAKRAMEMGKHVYVEKPLGHNVHETRILDQVARRTGVVTQMGNQGRSSDDVRRLRELIQGGAIGRVSEVHVWTDSPRWPSGMLRPSPEARLPERSGIDWRQDVPEILSNAIGGRYPLPPGLNWDLYLGPAPKVAYHPIYHPRNWRGWTDWGCSALGDMGAHLMDPPVSALGLGLPVSVQATATEWGRGPTGDPVSYPAVSAVHYEFGGGDAGNPVQLHWYEGGLMPPRPASIPDSVRFSQGGGYFVGEKGVLLYSSYGVGPQVYPESLQESAASLPERYPRVGMSHQMNWIESIRGNQQPTSPFSLAAPLTETILLGLIAARADRGAKLHYDGSQMRFTNHPELDTYLRRNEYHGGWTL